MTQESKELFRGHVEECLKHLSMAIHAKIPKGSREAVLIRQPIADFCGCELDSVYRWLNEGIIPIGQKLVKFMCFLDILGYKVIELEKLKKRFCLTEFIGYNVISIEDAGRELHYTSGSNILTILKGDQGISKERSSLAWELAKVHRQNLEAKKVSDAEKYRKIFFPILRAEEAFDPVFRAKNDLVSALLYLLEMNVNGVSLTDTEINALKAEEIDKFLRLSASLTTLSSKLIKLGHGKEATSA